MTTTVVNLRTDKYEAYIGRSTPFGNPYVIGPDGDRGEVIRKFEVDFNARIGRDPDFKAKVKALEGKVLG